MTMSSSIRVERQVYANDFLKILERNVRYYRSLNFDPSRSAYIDEYVHIDYDRMISALFEDCIGAGVEEEARDLIRVYGYRIKADVPIPVLDQERRREASLEALHGLLQNYIKNIDEIRRYRNRKLSRDTVRQSIFAAYTECLDAGLTKKELREIGDYYGFSFTGEKGPVPSAVLAAA